MKNKEKVKEKELLNKGITLIALVVTIVVLLILAGITIGSITSNNGIIKEAATAKEKTEKAGVEEQIEIAIITAEQKYRNPTLDNIIDEIKNVGVISNGSQVDRETGAITSNLGYVIEGKLDDYIKNLLQPGETASSTEKDNYTDGTDTATIPEGFTVSETEYTISTGLVVIAPDESEFVWIPVPDIDDFHTIEGYYGGSLDSILSDCSEPYADGYSTEVSEYNSMKSSVEENGGFYIGRYEAGKDSSGNVIVQKNATVYFVGWGNSMTNATGGAVELSKNFASEKGYTSVTSTLCYGVQWDAALQFIDSNYINGTCDSNSYLVNSTGKGNYSENYSGELINTGSNDDYAVKNIYDMAGNVCEWTMEAYNTAERVSRGGFYDINGSERFSFCSLLP